MRWTDDDVRFLRENYGKLTHDQLCESLGRKKWGVIRKITDLKLRHHWSKEEDDFLIANRKRSWMWCATQLGMSPEAVRSRAARLNIEKRGPLHESQVKRIRDLYDQGLGTTGIARELGCTDETARRWLRLWGLPPNKRDEKKRMSVQRENFKKNYGVENVAQATKAKQRRARLAAFHVQVNSLADALIKAERNTACPT